jgi:hypothetical protein
MSGVISPAQRHSKSRPCPICGGTPNDQRGKSKRCHGFVSADGAWAHCTREEHAGALVPNSESETYAHRLEGDCKCGQSHGGRQTTAKIAEAEYDYRDEAGTLAFQVVRYVGKQFTQRRPDGHGGWIYNLQGVERVLYRLPELVASTSESAVYVVEGEKDVETLRHRGLVATTNPQGAGKWSHVETCAHRVLRGRHIVLIPDADEKGRSHANDIAASLLGVAASVRRLEMPGAKDVTEWFAQDHSVADLLALVGEAAPATSDPWESELGQARADVQARLGAASATKRKPLFATTAADLLKAEFAPTQWQVTGLVTQRGTAVASGEPKAGIKTWMLIEGAIAIATGTKMFGEFYAERGTVAFFFAEDHAQSVRNRVRALLNGAGREAPTNLYLQPRGEFIDVLKDEDLAWIIASARRLPRLDLLVLDPLRDIHSAAEDKSDEMSPVMRRLRLLGEILGCTVWISHHDKKASTDGKGPRAGQGMRGSSAIHGSIDSGMYIKPKDGNGTNLFCAQVTSQVKNARSAGTFDLSLAIVDDENGEAVRAVWTYERAEAKKAATIGQFGDDIADENQEVVVWVRALAEQGLTFTRTELRNRRDRPLAEKKLLRVLDRCITAEVLRVAGGKVLPVAPGNQGAI